MSKITADRFLSARKSNVDKEGLPWDERIHSSSKALTADGLWRIKRGVTDGVVLEVEAELRYVMGFGPTLVVPASTADSKVAEVVVPASTADAKVAKAKLQFIQLFKETGVDMTISDEDVRMMVEDDEARQREEMLHRPGRLLHFPSASDAGITLRGLPV